MGSRFRAIGSILLMAVLFPISLSTTSCTPPRPTYAGYGYLIIAPQDVMQEMEDFADYKTAQEFLVEKVTLEEILADTPGNDGPEKIRNYLKGYATMTPQREFVLLVGSIDAIPMRIAHPDPLDHTESGTVPTDFYYEDLTSEWDSDGDGFFGEYGDDMTQETEDYVAEVSVGRIPWDEPEQIRAICDTIMRYEEDLSPRMTQALLAAAPLFTACDTAIPMELAKNVFFIPSGYTTTTLYEGCPLAEPDFELTQEGFLRQWEALNPGLAFLFSHGSSHGAFYNWFSDYFIDVEHLPQGVEPAMVVMVGCKSGSPDSTGPSLGRVLVKDRVSASFLGSSRDSRRGDNLLPIFLGMAEAARDLVIGGRCLAEAKAGFVESYAKHEAAPDNIPGAYLHQNLFIFLLYGDPSIQLP
jgi:hypothetical protein